MANIARLGVALGLNSAEFVTGIDAASRKLDQFATAAVGVAKNAALALGAALSVATYQAISYADELADVAAANDIAIDSIIKLTNALENIRERGRVLRSQKDGGLIEGFLFRMDTFGKNMETSFEAGGKAFDSLMGSMSKALDEFVTTGKLNFGDFAKSIIKDMLAIQLRASANNLFAMIGKSLFSSPVSLAEPLFGARADGGPVDSGGAYMVGERGPELFVPRSAGAIVPNHSMAMMGGSTNITNYNIQAIDTKSFEDRILGSSKAVWAANAYGAKNLSLGRGRT